MTLPSTDAMTQLPESPRPPRPAVAVSSAPRLAPERNRRVYEVSKRLSDIAFALLLLVASLPVWLIAAALVRLTSPGPVLFRQTRPGLNGEPFTLYKFRTMVVDAERILEQNTALSSQFAEGFKLRHDPRVTRVGYWLRKFSIDELPQLINVLRGEMSVVGPRPPLMEELAGWGPHEWQRMTVKPGLTCLWQATGRSAVGYQERIALDLEYIRRRGFRTDLLLILQTIPSVLSGRGAV